MSNRRKRYGKYSWVLGFLGLLGFRYFVEQDPAYLFYFSFFSFFSFYFTGKLANEMPDERYYENNLRARSVAFTVPAVALFIIGLTIVFDFATITIIASISAVGWAACFITYAVAFYYFEKY